MSHNRGKWRFGEREEVGQEVVEEGAKGATAGEAEGVDQ